MQRGLRHAAPEQEHPLEKLVLKSAGLARQPTAKEIEHLSAGVSAALSPLLSIATSGNVHAIRTVTELASHLCAETTSLACLHQDAANTVARERTTWPLNLSHDAKERRRALRLITGPRRLPLGDPPRPPAASRKSGGFSSPATAAVLVALKAIEIERSFRIPSELFPTLQPKWSAAAARLPELRTETAAEWFNVIWIYICERHGGAPEKSELQRIVKPRSSVSPGTSDAEIRSALRAVLEETFLRLAQGRAAAAQPKRRRRALPRA